MQDDIEGKNAYFPVSQFLHTSRPSTSAYMPTGQGKQSKAAASVLEYFPAMHFEQPSSAPIPENFPVAHGTHSEPYGVTFLKYPALHVEVQLNQTPPTRSTAGLPSIASNLNPRKDPNEMDLTLYTDHGYPYALS
jgi:hypothetical protein